MRHPALVLAFAASAAAWARRSTVEESWTPAQETSVAELNQAQLAMGMSPRPTDGPAAVFGRMLVPRIDDFTLGPKTCGFQSSDGVSITCITDGATCTYQSSHIGCCRPNENCNIVKTTCMDYDAVSAGSCNLPDDFHTLCCTNAASGACYTWIMSTTGTDDGSVETFTALQCSQTTGTGVLLDYDPAWARTHVFSSTSRSARPTTSDGPDGGSNKDNDSDESNRGNDNNNDDDKNGGGSKTNVGAIAGGAAGGAVALALVGAAIFFCMRRKKKNAAAKNSSPPSQGATPPVVLSTVHSPMSQSAPEPYWSGVPPSHQSYQQTPPGQPHYDPHASIYSQQGYNQQYPPQQFQGQYPNPHQSFQPGQYPPPQSSPVSYHAPSPGSPPPLTTPSPGVADVPPPQGNVNELQAVNPVGHESNRAELGPQ